MDKFFLTKAQEKNCYTCNQKATLVLEFPSALSEHLGIYICTDCLKELNAAIIAFNNTVICSKCNKPVPSEKTKMLHAEICCIKCLKELRASYSKQCESCLKAKFRKLKPTAVVRPCFVSTTKDIKCSNYKNMHENSE